MAVLHSCWDQQKYISVGRLRLGQGKLCLRFCYENDIPALYTVKFKR